MIYEAADRALELAFPVGYSRLGFAARSRLAGWTPPRPDSMAGRTALITGVTSGIGRRAAERLASLGARLYVVGRDAARTETARSQIAEVSGSDDVHLLVADLSDLDAVRRAAADFRERERRLDVLIHNAGALLADHTLTAAGLEATVATHVLGPFVLTNELLAPLRLSPDPRVITVSSGGMYTERLEVERLVMGPADYSGTTAYARAKRAQVVLNQEWAALMPGIAFHAMHPGWAATPGLADSLPTFDRVLGPLLRTPDQAADTIVWLASADEPAASTGQFWFDRRIRSTHRLPSTLEDPAQPRRLWDWAVRLSHRSPSKAA